MLLVDWFWLRGWLINKGAICTRTAPLFRIFISLFQNPPTGLVWKIGSQNLSIMRRRHLLWKHGRDCMHLLSFFCNNFLSSHITHVAFLCLDVCMYLRACSKMCALKNVSVQAHDASFKSFVPQQMREGSKSTKEGRERGRNGLYRNFLVVFIMAGILVTLSRI